jgi:3-hydroxyisobutyrate dehydrogenase-like beta-hydroxyacid dehydrogenase
MKHIGFIGVGNMGTPMAMCLIRAGHQLIVCDKRSNALEKFKVIGVSVTEKPADCAKSEMVIIMVGDDSQVEETLLGTNGLLKAVNLNQPPLLAIMSTILPGTVKKLASHCADKNVRLMDAPVSGMPVLAEKGKLSIMAGGERGDLEAMRPIFKIMGENIYHTGSLGTGNTTKLVNNIIGLTNLFLSAEAFQIGQKLGMDPRTLASIFENSTGRIFLTKDWENSRKIFEIFSQSLETSRVTVELACKDLEHAQQLAKEANVACPLFDHIVQAIHDLSYKEINERWHALIK